jgi:hypothetical protein
VISKGELPGHLDLRLLDAIQPCARCHQLIRMAKKLGKRHPLNRWCAVPMFYRPGRHQLLASALHRCDGYTRRVPIRSAP